VDCEYLKDLHRTIYVNSGQAEISPDGRFSNLHNDNGDFIVGTINNATMITFLTKIHQLEINKSYSELCKILFS